MLLRLKKSLKAKSFKKNLRGKKDLNIVDGTAMALLKIKACEKKYPFLTRFSTLKKHLYTKIIYSNPTFEGIIMLVEQLKGRVKKTFGFLPFF